MSIASHKISFTEDQITDILSETEKILRSGQVVLGDKTREFEEEYAAACNRAYGVAVGSDTAAFEMQLKTLGVKDEYVLYPALAFPSILESVYNAGAKGWFFDADIDGHLFARLDKVIWSAQQCQAETGKWPKALILMHTGGLIARDSLAITEWCEKNGITVLEDAAHSFGAELNGKKAGEFGLSSAFSLYATKPMHSCEGGMIVTDDENLAEECKIYRNYGRTQDFGRSVIVRHGYSWRITEIQSVIGLSNLRNISPNIGRRRWIMEQYDGMRMSSESEVWDQVTALPVADTMYPNGYRYILLLPDGWTGDRRLQWKQELKANTGIDLPGEVYELPTHKQPIWEEFNDLSFPVAEDFCNRHFALPVYPDLKDGQLEEIFTAVTESLEKVL